MSEYEGHTPGPWFVHDLRGIGGPISISCTTPDHITVADIGPGIENTEAEALANARLIAAAPDLLIERDRLREALENMPAVTIALRTPQERDIWDSWKRATFNPDGSVRTVLQEDRDE